MAADEWRVEVELVEEQHGRVLSERLGAHRVDDEARRRLGERVVVTREGPRLFLYSGTEGGAEEAKRVVRELLEAQGLEEGLDASVQVTRWHPVEEAWKDAAVPLPRTEEEVEAERRRLEAAEAAEAREQGEFDWEVRAELPSHRQLTELADRLEAEGLPVRRRWRYLRVGALTEERAAELAERLRAEGPEGTEVRVEANLDEPTNPFLVFLGSR